MERNDDDTYRDDSTGRHDAADGTAPAKPDPVRRAAETMLESLDPNLPSDQAVRRVIEDTLARIADAEARLVRAERRLEWLESRNVSDEVTGLLNRRGLADALHRGLARCRRYGETGALLLVDLPRHEEVIEAHGVEAGDYVLTAIANILRRRFREVDHIARLDGGRFAAHLVAISDDDARRRAASLKGHLDDVTVPWDGRDISVFVRVGLVHYAQNDMSEDILQRAEAELEEREQRAARLRNPAAE